WYDRPVQRPGAEGEKLQNGFAGIPLDPLQPLAAYGRRAGHSDAHPDVAFEPVAGRDGRNRRRDLVEEAGVLGRRSRLDNTVHLRVRTSNRDTSQIAVFWTNVRMDDHSGAKGVARH